MKVSKVLLCSRNPVSGVSGGQETPETGFLEQRRTLETLFLGFLVDKKIASTLQTLTRKDFFKFEKSPRCGGLIQANLCVALRPLLSGTPDGIFWLDAFVTNNLTYQRTGTLRRKILQIKEEKWSHRRNFTIWHFDFSFSVNTSYSFGNSGRFRSCLSSIYLHPILCSDSVNHVLTKITFFSFSQTCSRTNLQS